MAFNEFWGTGASTRGNEGVILLQEENIEKAIHKLGGTSISFDQATIGGNANRFFKAITWVNKWDAEAVKHIRAAFWQLGYAPPEMQHIMSSQSYTPLPTAPFVVSVGLFTEETKRFVKAYSGNNNLIDIIQTERGDAIEIYRALVADTDSLQSTGSEMLTLTPKHWERTKWTASEPTMDFGIILRHTITRQDSTKLMRFVVAGFTEQGTEAAGKYLAREWRHLHQRFWSQPEKTGRRGDFLIVVVGRSNDTNSWAEEPGINPITPQLMI